MASSSVTMPTSPVEMSGRIFLALTRLLKVQIRLYVYTKKAEEDPDSNWRSLVRVEQDFLAGAEREWSDVLGLLDDPAQRTELVNHLLGQAFEEALSSVTQKLRIAVPDVDLIVQSFRPGVRVE